MKPILFNTEMVKAILDGRKTVTRRVVKFPPGQTGRLPECGKKDYLFYPCGIKYPPYLTGEILYVREAFQQNYDGSYSYRAGHKFEKAGGWRPSIHMPRESARIFLRVTDVRAEKLQDMGEQDAIKEGFERSYIDSDVSVSIPAVSNFSDLWDSTIKPTDRARYGWDANPWVWVIEFERISKEAAHGLDTP